MNEPDLSLWDQPKKDLNLKEMVNLLSIYREKRDLHEKKKKESAEAYGEKKHIEDQIIAALKDAGQKSFKADDIGTISLVNKYVVRCPSDPRSKELLFLDIKKNHGKAVLYDKISMNHKTLNSFYNTSAEAWEEEQQLLEPRERKPFDLPGIEEPTLMQSVSFRKG